MNINVDFKVRRAIVALSRVFEDADEHGRPSSTELERGLEDFAEAVLQAAVDIAVRKVKTATLEAKTTDTVDPPATSS